MEAFGDVASLIAQMNPVQIIALKAPEKMSAEVEWLVTLKKEGVISYEQNVELERFLALDLFISITKARARALLSK
jgi:hypothetical protein